jgi:spoIIIJ-associated protein
MDKQETIQNLTTELLEKMGVGAKSKVLFNKDAYIIQIEAEGDAPLLIGKFGSTLKSLQTILEVMLFKQLGEKVDVMVNVGDYRERQKERVEGIAENIAKRVTADGQKVELDSFSAFERKLVHEYISANYPSLTSFSEGEGLDRKLVIALKTS